MQKKIERNRKRKNEDGSATPSCPSSPVPNAVFGTEISPYIDKRAPLGYDLLYSYSSWKHADTPAYTPDGHEKKRRKYEGSTHMYLKLGTLNFCEDDAPPLPEQQVHAIVVRIVNSSKRMEVDILKARTSGEVESGHFHYATRLIQTTLDLILKVYLSCQNRQEYLDSLNRHIMRGDFFNPFKIKMAYELTSSNTKDLALVQPEYLKSPVCEQDVKLVLIEQLLRLREKADQDYFSLNKSTNLSWQASAKETVIFAQSCLKKIAEFCRFFNTDQTLAFLSELNLIMIKQKFYHPGILTSLYLDDCMAYDVSMANTDACFQPLTLNDLKMIPENKLRKVFLFQPLTPKVHSVSSTITQETIEKFDEHGHLCERQNRITKEERTLFFSPARTTDGVDYEDDFKDDKSRCFNYSSPMK